MNPRTTVQPSIDGRFYDALGGGPPPSNTGVVNLGPRRVGDSSPYGWDWSSTTHERRDGLVRDLLTALGTRTILPGKGLQGWRQSVKAYDSEGHQLGAVFFGGREDLHVVSSSAAADRARRAVLAVDDEARTSRVDTRVDTLVPFEDLWAVCVSAAGRKARLTHVQSFEDGQSLGRTGYLGSPSSSVRVRVYEKWLESPGQYVEGTNRVEVQLRPPSRAKAGVSSWSPAETFCASEMTRRLASELGTEVARPGSLQKSRGTPDLEETMRAMGDQYGKAVERWLSVSGGDFGRVEDYLLRKGEAG